MHLPWGLPHELLNDFFRIPEHHYFLNSLGDFKTLIKHRKQQ